MKSRITTIIMTIIIFLIIVGFILFGIILFNDFLNDDVASGVQNFVSTVTSLGKTEEENITTPGIIETNIDDLEETPVGENSGEKYENVVVNDYFYNQLEETSKIFYRAFESNKENMKTGNYRIDFGDAFSDILNSSGGEEKLGDYYQSAVETYIYDHPEVFYINVNKMYLNIETTTRGNKVTYNVFINAGNQGSYLDSAYSSKEQIDTVVICKNYLSCIQYNTVIDGKTSTEVNGKLNADIIRKFLWFHKPSLYDSYDTYAKMKRYRKEWKGVSRQDIYSKEVQIDDRLFNGR